jgi:hypothetical protein
VSSFRVYSAASLAVVLVYDSSGIQLKGASRSMGEECLRLLVAAQLHDQVIDVVVCMVPVLLCKRLSRATVTYRTSIALRTPRIVALVRCRVPSGYCHTNWSRRYERERRVHSSGQGAGKVYDVTRHHTECIMHHQLYDSTHPQLFTSRTPRVRGLLQHRTLDGQAYVIVCGIQNPRDEVTAEARGRGTPHDCSVGGWVDAWRRSTFRIVVDEEDLPVLTGLHSAWRLFIPRHVRSDCVVWAGGCTSSSIVPATAVLTSDMTSPPTPGTWKWSWTLKITSESDRRMCDSDVLRILTCILTGDPVFVARPVEPFRAPRIKLLPSLRDDSRAEVGWPRSKGRC